MIYVIQVTPSKEMKVCTELIRDGIEAYVPRRELLIHKSGLWTKVINILFPGYVFIQMDYSAKLHIKVKHTDYVLRFLGSPTPLPQKEAALMEWLFNGGEIIKQSVALVNDDGFCIGYEGFLHGYEDRVTYFNKRQCKASVEVRFGGKVHRANLGIELKAADKTGQG